MKKSTLLPLLCLAAALPLLWTGCKKDPPCDDPLNPECPNYDRCLTVPKTNAEFGFYRKVDGIYIPRKDTVPISTGTVRMYFIASNTKMSSYEWKIGLDPRTFTDSIFFLDFSDVSGWVNISLTTQNNQFDAQCFPADSGISTVQKSIYFKRFTTENDTDWVQQYPIFGTYRGYEENAPSDTFNIRISFDHDRGQSVLNYFPKDCIRETAPVHFTTHYIYFSSTHCLKPEARGALQSDNRTLVIDYSLDGPNWTRVNKRWRGVKIE